MSAIQTSLAVLVAGSSLASKLPFIAPIAGLLHQGLTMRDARVLYISSDNVLMTQSSTGREPEHFYFEIYPATRLAISFKHLYPTPPLEEVCHVSSKSNFWHSSGPP
jgi:hypothetical protein